MERDKEFVRAMADYTDAVLEAIEDIVSRVSLWEKDIQRRIRRGEMTNAQTDLRDTAHTCHTIALLMRDYAINLHKIFISMTKISK